MLKMTSVLTLPAFQGWWSHMLSLKNIKNTPGTQHLSVKTQPHFFSAGRYIIPPHTPLNLRLDMHEVQGRPPWTAQPATSAPRTPHLDPAYGFLGLHHAHVFGGGFVWEQLGGAKVIGSKNDSIDQVFGVTGSGNCNTQSRSGEWSRPGGRGADELLTEPSPSPTVDNSAGSPVRRHPARPRHLSGPAFIYPLFSEGRDDFLFIHFTQATDCEKWCVYYMKHKIQWQRVSCLLLDCELFGDKRPCHAHLWLSCLIRACHPVGIK